MKFTRHKLEGIKQQILCVLQKKPRIFTSHIAKEIGRDEELIQRLLYDLKAQGLVSEIKQSENGKNNYLRRRKWELK